MLSLKHAAFVCRDHVLDVDVGVLTSIPLKELQGFVDQFADIFILVLSVLHFVANVCALVFEHVENG
jgi:hypothetical protein